MKDGLPLPRGEDRGEGGRFLPLNNSGEVVGIPDYFAGSA